DWDRSSPAGGRNIHVQAWPRRPASLLAQASQLKETISGFAALLRHRAWLHLPDLGCVFRDCAVAGKLSGTSFIKNSLASPLVRVGIKLAHQMVRIEIRF